MDNKQKIITIIIALVFSVSAYTWLFIYNWKLAIALMLIIGSNNIASSNE